MAGQILQKTAAEAATFKLAPLDLLFIVDENGVRTGELRIGDGITAGGVAVDGVAGGTAGVTTWNNESGNVTAGLDDLNGVSVPSPSEGDVLTYNGSSFVASPVDLDDVGGVSTSGAEEGRVLMYDNKGVFSPADIPAAPGDDLGNHQATQDLQMLGNDIVGVEKVALGGDDDKWAMSADVGPGRLAFSRKNDGTNPVYSAVLYEGFTESNNRPNDNGLLLTAYGSNRASDATANPALNIAGTPVTNLCYFSNTGQLLKATPAEVSIGAFGGVDITTAQPTDGQVLAFDQATGNFVPTDAATGGGDDLGSHVATQTLDLASEDLQGVNELRLSGDEGRWLMNANVGAGRLAFARKNGTGAPTYSFIVYEGYGATQSKPNQDGLLIPAYNAARLSDATGDQGGQVSTPVTNLAYFSNAGQLLKAPTSDVSIGTFGDVDLTSIASGDMLYYNGTAFVRIPKGTDGQTLTLVGGVPTWS